MKIYVNGKMVDEKDAEISVYDHGFLYGAGIFETFRSYNGHLFLFADHCNRLQQAAKFFDIHFPLTNQELQQEIFKLLQYNKLSNAYIRVSLSAGAEGLGIQGKKYLHPSLVIYVKELPPLSDELYRKGKALIPINSVSIYPNSVRRFKTMNFLPNILAKREIGSDPMVEGALLSPRGHVAEGIVSNLFYIKNQTLYTPALELGILPGITRKMVIALAIKQGYEVKEGLYPFDLWKEADEVFMTNSIQEIVPITRMVDSIIGKGYIGVITEDLLHKYRLLTEKLLKVDDL